MHTENLPITYTALHKQWSQASCGLLLQHDGHDEQRYATTIMATIGTAFKLSADQEQEASRCKTILAEAIQLIINRKNVSLLQARMNAQEHSSDAQLEEKPKVVAIALALAYKDTLYHAQTSWDTSHARTSQPPFAPYPYFDAHMVHTTASPITLRIDEHGTPVVDRG